MQKIIFDKIRIANFLSYGNKPVEFNYSTGLTFITGKNIDTGSYNGVGKTTILVEAISFALFGETYRDFKQSEIIHRNSSDSCTVELWFTVNNDSYKITRSLKPNKLFLIKNETEDITKTIPETNKDILSIIGINKNIFNNTLVMSNDSKNKFLGQPKDTKTKFIEGILSLEVFSKMLDTVKKNYNDHSKLVDKSETIIEEIKKSISSDKKYKDDFDTKKQNQILILQNQISTLSNIIPINHSSDILSTNEQIEHIKSNEIPPLNTKIQKGKNKKSEIYGIISSLQKDLDKFNNIKLVCPTCKQPLGNHNPTDIEKEKTSISIQINEQKTLVNKYDSAISKVELEISEKEKNIKLLFAKAKEFLVEQEKFDNFTKTKTELELKISELEKQINPFVKKIEEQETKLEEIKTKHEELEKELLIKDAMKFVVSGQGVKSIIVKKILDVLNNRLEYYLKKLNSEYFVKFNEFFEEEITDTKGRNISYGNVSGGEAKRIDFALLFAFRDIRKLQSGVSVNITVLDELLDSGLCINGQEEIQSMLLEMSENNNECFYIITHRPDAIPTNANIIHLENKDGVTKIVVD